MLQRILIAEDHPSNSLSLKKIVEDLKIRYEPQSYCDEALAAIKKAIREDNPYDLLICDLSFDQDGHPQNITQGKDLIEEARRAQPSLKILVFSVENKPYLIKPLFSEQNVDGYVMKGRRDIEDLREALSAIGAGRRYIPARIRQLLKQSEQYEFDQLDLAIIQLLCEGENQKDIPARLEQMGFGSSSLSRIEKRLGDMRRTLELSNNTQLIAYCKDLGIV